MKTCHVCLKTMDYDKFQYNESCKDGFNNMCNKCARVYNRYRRHKLKEHQAKSLKTLHIKAPKIKQKIFWSPPVTAPDPAHAVTVDREPVTVRFE